MGNTEEIKTEENEENKKIIEILNQTHKTIIDYINNSFFALTKNKQEIKFKDLEKWKNNILININTEIENLIELFINNKEIIKSDEINNKKEYKIERSNELNTFTPKDIEEENKEITRNFQNEAFNYINTNENVENENIALFLKEVATIARTAFNEGKHLNKMMKENYYKIKGNKFSLNDENYKKDFSCFIKNIEKERGVKEYDNFFEKKDNIDKEFLMQLFKDLTIMYFHCGISFPLVEINFNKDDDFNSEKMIDFINRGKNRKVNFIILPSLFSNGNFLQNGKYWVFTYYKTTFRFKEGINDTLNELLVQDNLVIKNIKDNFQMKAYCKNKKEGKIITIITNMDIPENIKYEFCLHLYDKNNKKIIKKKTKQKILEIKEYNQIVKYEFKLQDEIIISSTNIINEA